MSDTAPSQGVAGGPPASKRHRGGKKGQKKPPGLLVDMRTILRQPEAKDKPQHAALRQMFKDDAKGFVKTVADLEKAYQTARSQRVAGGEPAKAPEKEKPAVKDEGEERVLELIERILADVRTP